MAIPQAIQQQIEQAEALQAEVYPVEVAPVQAAEPVTPAEPVAEPPSNVVELPRQAEPVQQAEPKPEASEDAAYWKQRFSTLQGKFNAEVPLLHQQLKEQGSQLHQLMEKLTEKDKPAELQEELVTSKDTEDYGADLIDMTRRVATEVVRKVITQEMAKFRQELGAVQDQVGQVGEQVAMTASDRFWAGVMTLVPDWKAVDTNPQWVAWLDTKPKFARRTYRELATEAIESGDAETIANLVEVWRGPQQAAPTPIPVPQVSQAQAELQRQVAPSTSRASSSTPAPGRIWSGAEYTEAMDVRNPKRYGQAKADQMEAEANLAHAEGRVRW